MFISVDVDGWMLWDKAELVVGRVDLAGLDRIRPEGCRRVGDGVGGGGGVSWKWWAAAL